MKRWLFGLLALSSLIVTTLAIGLALSRPTRVSVDVRFSEQQILSQTLPDGVDCLRWYWFELPLPNREPPRNYQAFGTGFVYPFLGSEVIETIFHEQTNVGEGSAHFFTGLTPFAIQYQPAPAGYRGLHGFFLPNTASGETCERLIERAGPAADVDGTVPIAGGGQAVLTVRRVSVAPHGETALRRHPGPALILKVDGELTARIGRDTVPLARYKGFAEQATVAGNTPYLVRNSSDAPAGYLLVTVTPVGQAVDGE